jgi:D-alanine-D-alanine ligase
MHSARRQQVSDPRDFGRVAVLLGGTSAEREVSLNSGRAVLAALAHRGVDAHAIDPADGPLARLLDERFDRVWIALHGGYGEDGRMQGALEILGLPYTGSGVLGCALSMDKYRSKLVLEAAGLPTPPWRLVRDGSDLAGLSDALGLPLVIKPAREGSSVGISKVSAVSELESAWQLARGCDELVLAERWIRGGEFTASLLQEEALPLIRIETPRTFYDYEAKYLADSTRYHCPSGLAPETEARFQEMSRRAFEVLGGAGWGRVDFMLDEQERPFILELNTVPGMTDHSLVPMAARQAGIGFDELVWRILETSVATAAVAPPLEQRA